MTLRCLLNPWRFRAGKNNAKKPLCEETLEDGGDPAGYLCSNADTALGSDDLGLKYWSLFWFHCIYQLNRIRLKKSALLISIKNKTQINY